MLDYLKVKLLSLTAEAKIIRQMENRRLKKANYARQLLNLDKTIERHNRQVIRLRMELRDHTFKEYKIGRDSVDDRNNLRMRIMFHENEILRLICRSNKTKVRNATVEYNDHVYWGLHQHRIEDVRKEARNTCLAYGFLKGKTYNEIEKKVKTKPDWRRVMQLVLKYGEGDPEIMKQQFKKWQEDGAVKKSEIEFVL